jgi:hypothetical protein
MFAHQCINPFFLSVYLCQDALAIIGGARIITWECLSFLVLLCRKLETIAPSNTLDSGEKVDIGRHKITSIFRYKLMRFSGTINDENLPLRGSPAPSACFKVRNNSQ